MSWETVLLLAVLGVLSLLAWRETRIRRVSAMKKTLKRIESRLQRVETALAELPGPEVLSEFSERITVAEKKASGSVPARLEVLVDRLNEVSNDMTLLKSEHQGMKNDITKLRTQSTWARLAEKDG